ncbi:MAG: PilN domain-containing protein [Luminiphilus sp.]|nr:PilN domain-containing protein [Luminiphilus sp.]
MGQVTNNWSLFGLDLTRAGKWLALGFEQLLYDRDAWLLRRFDPPVTLFSDGKESLYQADKLCGETARGDSGRSDYRSDTRHCAVALPQDAVLLKTVQLPAAGEEDLESAMALEVDLSSPFSDQNTRAAWRVVFRSELMLEVALAITSQAAIDQTLADTELPIEDGVAEPPEVWALTDNGIPISFAGFGGQKRRAAYHGKLKHLVGFWGALWTVLMLGLMVIAFATSLRADRLNAVFQQVRVDASEAAQRRQELELGRTRLGSIQGAIVERPNYQYWLNHIAASAPDTVYFDRLNFDGSSVIVSGYSNNASVYLRMLTEESGYTDVAALSAFARDRSNGLERFSIQWRVTEPPQPLAEEPLAKATERSVGEGP